jgi:hypothetical protein
MLSSSGSNIQEEHRLLDPEDEDNRILQNFWNKLPNHTARHSKRFESSRHETQAVLEMKLTGSRRIFVYRKLVRQATRKCS